MNSDCVTDDTETGGLLSMLCTEERQHHLLMQVGQELIHTWLGPSLHFGEGAEPPTDAKRLLQECTGGVRKASPIALYAPEAHGYFSIHTFVIKERNLVRSEAPPTDLRTNQILRFLL